VNPNTKRNKIGLSLKRICALVIVFLFCLLTSALLWWRSGAVHGQTRASFAVRSASFSDGGAIPRQYTCDGVNLSPQLQWQSAPAGTKSFALEMDDPDASIDFTHWLAWNIPAGVRELAESASPHGAMPAGSVEGTNDFGRLGYGGPCPPRGSPHHYMLRIYALDQVLDLPPGATAKQLGAAMVHHILGQGTIVGSYQRKGQ
jgi:Raf kinase inhibitor-like YbhB/YbcL family protein